MNNNVDVSNSLSYNTHMIRIANSLVLLFIAIIAIIPPVLYKYLYPTTGYDSIIHATRIESTTQIGLPYYATYSLHLVHKVTGVSGLSILSIVTPLALILIGFVVWYFAKKEFGEVASIIIPLLVIIATPSTLNLYYHGVIPNLINLLIFFPILLWLIINKKWVAAIILCAVMGLFHEPTSKQLAIAIPSAMLGLVLFTKYPKIKAVVLTIVMLICLLIPFAVISSIWPSNESLLSDMNELVETAQPWYNFWLLPIFLLGLTILAYKYIKPTHLTNTQCIILLAILGVVAASVVGVLVLDNIGLENRISANASILLVLMLGLIFSKFLTESSVYGKIIRLATVAFIFTQLLIFTPTALLPHSAFTYDDYKAIKSLNITYPVTLSPSINKPILDSYTTLEISESADYILWKNSPMTGCEYYTNPTGETIAKNNGWRVLLK